MKVLLSISAIVFGLTIGLSAQQATPIQATQSPDNSQPQSGDTSNQRRSVQSFEGQITRSGDKLVLQENAGQTTYQLDDQNGARRFEGKNVKVMATVDADNTLHVIDIEPVETD